MAGVAAALRLFGKRTLTKLTPFDLVNTVALGSTRIACLAGDRRGTNCAHEHWRLRQNPQLRHANGASYRTVAQGEEAAIALVAVDNADKFSIIAGR